MDCKKTKPREYIYIYIYKLSAKKVSKDNVKKKCIYKVLLFDCISRQIHVLAILVRRNRWCHLKLLCLHLCCTCNVIHINKASLYFTLLI